MTVTMSPVASHGKAIGYLMPPLSWIVLAAAFISSNVVGGVQTDLVEHVLAVGHDVDLGLHRQRVQLAVVGHRLARIDLSRSSSL